MTGQVTTLNSNALSEHKICANKALKYFHLCMYGFGLFFVVVKKLRDVLVTDRMIISNYMIQGKLKVKKSEYLVKMVFDIVIS